MKLFAAAAMAVALLGATSASAAANLVTNGDFETAVNPATPGFATDYAYASGPNSMYPEGTWTVGTNPNAVHDQWVNVAGSNNMLILNGKTSGLPSTAWSQDIAVTGGQYAFSFDAMNICCKEGYSGENLPSLLSLAYSTDGGATFTSLANITTNPPGDAGVFQSQNGTFSVGAGVLRLSILNTAGAYGGNDFAVDNIVLTEVGRGGGPVPEPATWAMMILGFGFAGSALRAQRRAFAA